MSTLRLGGLASGIDTDSVIKQLMAAQRIPVDKLKQQKQIIDWQVDDYRTLNSKILEFRNSAFDMKLQSSYMTKKISSSDESIVSVSATGSANEGQYSLKIKQLAKAASLTTGELGGVSGTEKTLGGTDGLGLAADNVLTVKGLKGSVDFNITTGETIGQLVTDINSKATSTGVKVTYDKTMDRLFFVSTKTGDSTNITLSLGGGADANTLFNLSGTGSSSTVGKNAIVEFNGVEAQYDTNTFTIGGMNFTAKKEDAATTVNIGVTQDVDAVVDKIKKFVDTYNSLIDEVNKKISEKKNRDYQPLTDEQREGMSEEQIEKWEKQAKSGMLANDPLLTNGLYSFRNALSASVIGLPTGQLNSLSAIGISNTNISGSTISGTYMDQGKLYIDETKLKDAITANPDEVMALFNTDSSTSSGDGIATRLYDQASSIFSQIMDKAGDTASIITNYSLGKNSLDIDNRISDMNVRLQQIEDRYYKQFTAMESFINQMNSQSNWLYQQFNTGG